MSNESRQSGSSNTWVEYDDDQASTPVVCSDCGWTGPIYATKIILNFRERVLAGEIVPAGECPKCGALAHLKKKDPIIKMDGNVLTIILPDKS